VREIGCSNFDAQQIDAAQSAARGARFVSVQNEYSLLKRDPERGVLDACAKHELGFLPYFPLASGVLTGKYAKDAPAPRATRLSDAKGQLATRFLSERNLELAKRLEDYAGQSGHSLLELAFSWLLARPTVVSVIAGATSSNQIEANASAATWQLTSEDLEQIDRLTR
jgi:aryl-alcohol dehydrogenase-like predicted oxidoreductase